MGTTAGVGLSRRRRWGCRVRGSKDASAMIEQMLQALGRQRQYACIRGAAAALGVSCEFCLEDVVDFLFDCRQLGFVARMTDAVSQRVERIDRTLGWAKSHEIPSRGQNRSQRTKQHR